jgi:outer membrane immunogenic protein
MLKYAFAFAALAATAPILTAPALAQDTPTTFNGPYVGIQGGWQQDRQTLDVTNNGLTTSASQNKSGFGYGGQIGYDFRLSPQVVFGIEVDATGRTGSGQLGGPNGLDLKQGRTLAATARLGYLVAPDSLLYVRGGYANGRFTLRDATTNISENRDGWQIGAGYEQMVAQNVSARIEYAYSKFGSDSLPALATNLGASDARVKYSRNAVTAGLNFRF